MSYVTLGNNIFRGKATPIQFLDEDRLRHMYLIGKTGVGKSTLLANMALQDIINLKGLCFIDPHGETIEWLLSRIPDSRLEDVVLFDPADTEHPAGLNLLEAGNEREKNFLVSELIEIFYKLFDPQRTGIIGPQFEHWLRNAALTIMADPQGGSLLEIPKLFTDKSFERQKRRLLTDPLVKEFWSGQMAKTADFHKSEMLNYFTSKFGHFLNDSLCRNIIGQTKNSLHFEELLAQEKILLVNLSKGKIGELNARFLGLILISKLQAAVLKRAYLAPGSFPPFYLYVDEFQNLTTDTFAGMLSESRKYGLGVHLTNQYFAQLPESLRTAVLGNVGSMIAFQLGIEDAETLAKEFAPFSKADLVNLEKYNFYLKLMSRGQATPPFSGVSLPPLPSAAESVGPYIRQLAQLAYGAPRLLVEQQLAYRLKL
ncbi:MAG TPA: TraM recognition domain-containing protein [Patescibacteria group bacterium]|nr:TraM recognition domain-containing protein [Patescibacteria group bacterium]